ncbi:hypothetical protein HPB49_021021 [Dermacentor silvarum]|uniref:Uncharacterized protein n=1 Tax=Dermacentor silvarum TaxID=543639 RepID=A0ACB8DLH3_DERSI|nr:hypothetical protein HPB49_021021 [Dermacentor silvarum]
MRLLFSFLLSWRNMTKFGAYKLKDYSDYTASPLNMLALTPFVPLSPAMSRWKRTMSSVIDPRHMSTTLSRQLFSELTKLYECKRLQQFIYAEELGDRQPTKLLCHVQALLGDRAATFGQQLLREIFLQ